MATPMISNFISKIWPKDSNIDETAIEFLKDFLLEDSLNGLTFGGLYIPEELMVNIFANLGLEDILRCSLVCKSWFNIAKSNTLWQTIYNRKYYPKKAKNLPWYVFYCYFATENFTNLIKNGNGEEQFDHWKIVLNDGDEFCVEEVPLGSDPLPEGVPEFHGHTSCFVTSYSDCVKYQKIDLKPKRLLRYIIRKYKPSLYASEWFSGRFDCGCIYKLIIICDVKGSETKWEQKDVRIRYRGGNRIPGWLSATYSKTVEGRVEQWAGKAWEKKELLYEDYPEEVETIYFCHMGKDLQFWAGHYGSKMAGGVLRFNFDSIKPLPEDENDCVDIYSQ